MPERTPATSIGRNDPCPCGSGKKYKRCCQGRDTATAAPPRDVAIDVPETLRQAGALERSGRIEDAIRLYRQVVRQQPRNADALYRLGRSMEQSGRLEQGIDLLRRAIGIDDASARYHGHLAAMQLRQGRPADALASVERAIAIDPDDWLPHHTLAQCLERLNRLDEAAAAAERAVSRADDNPAAVMHLATLARRRGALEDARRRLDELLARDDLPSPIRRHACNELGLTLDRLGRHEQAFDAFAACGRETLNDPVAQRLDPGEWSRRIDAYRTVLTPALVAGWKDRPGDAGRRAPVFMVGFPRSGTTMTEQVLAAHPEIVTSDEEPLTRVLDEGVHELLGAGPVAQCLETLSEDHAATLRRRYWAAAERAANRRLEADVFVDKLPLNITELGMINAIFPDARVIVALRDPRDVCLSCFMQDFRLNRAMIHFVSLERTVAFYARVMTLWLELRDMITLPYLEVRYEDTVADLTTQARRLLDFLGVAWDEGVLDFHERARERLISTPSYAAVTERVHTRAIGRWRKYAAFFEPWQDRLEPFVEAFGYGADPAG